MNVLALLARIAKYLGLALAGAQDLIQLIRWIDGADVERPLVLTKLPQEAQSSAIRARMRAMAEAKFEKKET